jgi:hypothetical protein
MVNGKVVELVEVCIVSEFDKHRAVSQVAVASVQRVVEMHHCNGSSIGALLTCCAGTVLAALK